MTTETPDQRVAAAVSAEMRRQGIAARALAEQLGWDDSYLWRRTTDSLEAVPMSMSDLQALAVALGVSVTALIAPKVSA